MTDTTNKKGVNPFTTAVVGAAVGAAAVALSKKENREKIRSKAQEIMNKGGKSLKTVQEKIDEAKEESKLKLADTLEKASDKIKKDKTTPME